MNIVRAKSKATVDLLRKWARDDRGDVPIGTILIIALVVIPLLLLLIFYRKEVVKMFEDQWKNLVGKGNEGAKGK